MKKLLIVSTLILVGLVLVKTGIHKLYAAEYNFYFGTDEKKAEPKQEEAQAEWQEKVSQQEAAQIAAQVSQDVYPPKKERVFLTLPKTYLSVGTEMSLYSPKTDADLDFHSVYAPYVNVRLKYLPIFTLEAAIPLSDFHDEFNVYKGGVMLELNLTRWWSIHAAGWVLFNERGKSENGDTNAGQFAGYVGAGTKLRLFNHFDLWATVNAVPTEFRGGWSNIRYGYGPHIEADVLASVGAALSF